MKTYSFEEDTLTVEEEEAARAEELEADCADWLFSLPVVRKPDFTPEYTAHIRERIAKAIGEEKNMSKLDNIIKKLSESQLKSQKQ